MNLYDLGWHQGTVFAQALVASVVGRDDVCFHRWIVCTQDCDLSNADPNSTETIVELRPVLSDNPPQDWGIRSGKLLLRGQDYVDGSQPRVCLTAIQLTKFADFREPVLTQHRLRAFKTWLGRRYDRPAVPTHLIGIAREVAKRCEFRPGRQTARMIHDVLMQFKEDESPPHVALYAVVTDDADIAAVESWLADVSSRINSDLGVVASIRAVTRAQTSLQLIETSYAADLSQLTWREEIPSGAE